MTRRACLEFMVDGTENNIRYCWGIQQYGSSSPLPSYKTLNNAYVVIQVHVIPDKRFKFAPTFKSIFIKATKLNMKFSSCIKNA